MKNKILKIMDSDIIEFNDYIKGRLGRNSNKKIAPKLKKYFKTDKEYEDYMFEYQESHMSLETDPAIIGNNKCFSAQGNKLITIECNDDDKGLENFLNALADIANQGHCTEIAIDPDLEETHKSFTFDGDGPCRIFDIKVKSVKTESIKYNPRTKKFSNI